MKNVTKWVTGFMQTDFAAADINIGGDVHLIDGWIMVKPQRQPWLMYEPRQGSSTENLCRSRYGP